MELVADNEVMAGKDVEGLLKVQNKCNEERQIVIAWKTYILRYDGVVIKELEKKKQDLTVAGEKGLF